MKSWFRHGKWPKVLVRLHYYSIVSFVMLMLTGVALFWPPVHTALIPYLPAIYDLHVILGIIFALTLLVPVGYKLPVGKLIRRLDWLFPMLLGGSIVVTGFMLWRVTWFPTVWRSVAFLWHGRISYVLAIWLVIHGVYKAFSYRPDNDGWNGKVDPERRRFVRWLGLGLAGTAILTVVDPVGFLARVLSSDGRKGTATGGTFAEYYTVTSGFPATTEVAYRLQIGGLVEKSVSLRFEQLKALKSTSEQTDFHCVTGWSVANVQWRGVHLKTIGDLVRPTSQAKYVHFYSFDGAYTECLSVDEALDPSVQLAYELDGQPLTVPQGFPLRLVVPKMYGYKSIKWVNRIEYSAEPLTGYWEARGYPNEAYVGGSI